MLTALISTVLVASSALGIRHYLCLTCGPLLSVFFPRPFALIHKTVVINYDKTRPDRLAVYRLTFETYQENKSINVNLGLGEHVKITIPPTYISPFPRSKNSKNRRSYSPCYFPYNRNGSFDLVVKQYPNGFLSNYLTNLNVGDKVSMSRGWPLPAEWMMKKRHYNSTVLAPLRVCVVALGIGITEALPVVISELSISHTSVVTLLYSTKYKDERLFLQEISNLKQQYPHRFRIQCIVSRENNNNNTYATTNHNNTVIGNINPSSPISPSPINNNNNDDDDDIYYGRLNPLVLSSVLSEWAYAPKDSIRFLVAGTKTMKKDIHSMFEQMGYSYDQHILFKKQLLPRN